MKRLQTMGLAGLVAFASTALVSTQATAQTVFRYGSSPYYGNAPYYGNTYSPNYGTPVYNFATPLGGVQVVTPQRYSSGYRGTYNTVPYQSYSPSYNNGYYGNPVYTNPGYSGNYYGNGYYGGGYNLTPSQQRGAVIGGTIGGAVGGQRGSNVGAAIGRVIGNQ